MTTTQPSQAARDAARTFWIEYCGGNPLAWASLSQSAQGETAQAFARFERDTEQRVRESLAGEANVERVARDALKPFADCCDQIAGDEDDEEWAKFRLLIKDYRRARAALATLERTTDE